MWPLMLNVHIGQSLSDWLRPELMEAPVHDWTILAPTLALTHTEHETPITKSRWCQLLQTSSSPRLGSTIFFTLWHQPPLHCVEVRFFWTSLWGELPCYFQAAPLSQSFKWFCNSIGARCIDRELPCDLGPRSGEACGVGLSGGGLSCTHTQPVNRKWFCKGTAHVRRTRVEDSGLKKMEICSAKQSRQGAAREMCCCFDIC